MKRHGFVIALVCLTAASARADEVLFKNGDRLQGSIVRMEAGTLVLATEVAGEVQIPMEKVLTFRTSGAAELHLDDGTVVRQRIESGSEGSIRFAEGGSLVSQALDLASIRAINPTPPEEIQWHGDVTAGLTIRRGNTDKQDGSAKVHGERESEVDRVTFDAEYRGERSRDQDSHVNTTSERYYMTGLKYDYFIRDDVYVYGLGRAEKDAPANIDIRFTAGTGLGRQWVSTDERILETEAGLTWVSENFSDDTRDNDFLAARLAWRFEQQVRANVRFFHKGEWLPSLEDNDDMLVKSETGIRADLTDRIFGEAKLIFDWDSTPADGQKRQDAAYIFAAGYRF